MARRNSPRILQAQRRPRLKTSGQHVRGEGTLRGCQKRSAYQWMKAVLNVAICSWSRETPRTVSRTASATRRRIIAVDI
ncbi:hypothetical protein BT69DRAFT_908618 [Atractiella rhizophila]|nr:hypothetical protein BT69DRAFT_908618 [Atractiella rhizophila]